MALGSNLHQPRERVAEALQRLGAVGSTRLVATSRWYATRPLGPQDQPHFVNAAAGLLTQLAPRALLDALLGIERDMGRRRAERWGPRLIDLDLLWITGAPVHEPGLDLPHPGVSERNFVLYPLCDLAPTLLIPGLGVVADLKARVNRDGITELRDVPESAG